jgi:hypothetical protein
LRLGALRTSRAPSRLLSSTELSATITIMKIEEFEQTLRQHLRREPFQPFVVELLDGRIIPVYTPKVVFGGGAASFFTPDYDLVEFACEDVQAIRPAVFGASA